MVMDGRMKATHEKHTRVGSTGPYKPNGHRKVERQLKLKRHAHDGSDRAATKHAHSKEQRNQHSLTDAGTH
jgi:hypothetical protein